MMRSNLHLYRVHGIFDKLSTRHSGTKIGNMEIRVEQKQRICDCMDNI